jgi:hypothetical protein
MMLVKGPDFSRVAKIFHDLSAIFSRRFRAEDAEFKQVGKTGGHKRHPNAEFGMRSVERGVNCGGKRGNESGV